MIRFYHTHDSEDVIWDKQKGLDMKKMLKIIGVLLLVICACAVAVRLTGKGSTISKDYNSSIKTGGAIEAKYLQNGQYDVSLYRGVPSCSDLMTRPPFSGAMAPP